MEVFICILLVILVVLIVFNTIYKFKDISNIKTLSLKKDNNKLQEEKESFFPMIQIIESNKIVPSEKLKISDSKIINSLITIDHLAPKTTSVVKSIKNAREISKNVLFSASEKDAKKMLSAGKNKYFGTQISSKTKKFTNQTKFTKESDFTKNMTKQQLTNVGFNAVSAIVGQYYMSQINDKLEEINNNINEISKFQNSEYQGKLFHIISKIKEILDNQNEILSNDELRKNSYHDNKELERICVQLLSQANDRINKELTNESLDYKKYEAKVKNIEAWFLRQQLTQELLMEIGDLRYALANGSETFNLSHTQYNNCLKITNNVNKHLEIWNNAYMTKFGIDIDKQRKKGNLYKLRKYTLGMINEDWNYEKLQNSTIQQIASQIQPKEFKLYENNKQDEKIIIQKYNGEYYNLPSDIEEINSLKDMSDKTKY